MLVLNNIIVCQYINCYVKLFTITDGANAVIMCIRPILYVQACYCQIHPSDTSLYRVESVLKHTGDLIVKETNLIVYYYLSITCIKDTRSLFVCLIVNIVNTYNYFIMFRGISLKFIYSII